MAQSPPVDGARVKAIEADVSASEDKMHEILPGLELLLDPTARTQIASKAIPMLVHLSADFDEWGKIDPARKSEFLPAQAQYLMIRSVLGDKAAIDALQALAHSTNPDDAMQGRSEQLTALWISATKDSDAQAKVADELEAMAKAHPQSDDLMVQLATLSELGPATPELRQRLEDLVLNVMKDPAGEEVRERILSERKLKLMENKPLVIAGKLVDGKNFSTEGWKGKVVLVDFWATWCRPCLAELPRVKKAYANFHSKGLEVLGVSNDYGADNVTQFLNQNREMTWPQLFDATAAAQQQWNPVTSGLGIINLPTMFLIDKKGIVRSVTARDNFEEMIPKLIAE